MMYQGRSVTFSQNSFSHNYIAVLLYRNIVFFVVCVKISVIMSCVCFLPLLTGDGVVGFSKTELFHM